MVPSSFCILHFSFLIFHSQCFSHEVSHVRVRGFEIDSQAGFAQGFGARRSDRPDSAALRRRQE